MAIWWGQPFQKPKPKAKARAHLWSLPGKECAVEAVSEKAESMRLQKQEHSFTWTHQRVNSWKHLKRQKDNEKTKRNCLFLNICYKLPFNSASDLVLHFGDDISWINGGKTWILQCPFFHPKLSEIGWLREIFPLKCCQWKWKIRLAAVALENWWATVNRQWSMQKCTSGLMKCNGTLRWARCNLSR